MFMPDAIEATIALMEAPLHEVSFHIGYNIKGFNCTPAEIADAIRKHIPDFSISYSPDFRQEIADSWPNSVDDHYARCHEHWSSKYNLEMTTEIMINQLREKLRTG